MTNDELAKEAVNWVKRNKEVFLQRLMENANSASSENPAAVFMAGTPGAGKTEVARSLISLFDIEPLRIDADDFRDFIPGYNGSNSHVVQPAAALAVDKVVDMVYKKRLPFILDATFAVGKASVNIKRALRRGYEVQIYFVYQDPLEAWSFTKIRERKEGQHVPKRVFIDSYFKSRENVQKVKEEFGDDILLRLIVKSYQAGTRDIYDKIDEVEKYLPKTYTKGQLERLIK